MSERHSSCYCWCDVTFNFSFNNIEEILSAFNNIREEVIFGLLLYQESTSSWTRSLMGGIIWWFMSDKADYRRCQMLSNMAHSSCLINGAFAEHFNARGPCLSRGKLLISCRHLRIVASFILLIINCHSQVMTCSILQCSILTTRGPVSAAWISHLWRMSHLFALRLNSSFSTLIILLFRYAILQHIISRCSRCKFDESTGHAKED